MTSASDGLLEEMLKSKPMIFQAPLLFRMMFSVHRLPCTIFTLLCRNERPSDICIEEAWNTEEFLSTIFNERSVRQTEPKRNHAYNLQYVCNDLCNGRMLQDMMKHFYTKRICRCQKDIGGHSITGIKTIQEIRLLGNHQVSQFCPWLDL